MQLALRPDMTTGVVDCGPPGSATRLRPWVTAGIAIAGASMIAATPVAPPLPDIQARAVQLSAAAGSAVTDLAGEVGNVFSSITGAGGSSGIGDVLSGGLPNLGGLLSGLEDGSFLNFADPSAFPTIGPVQAVTDTAANLQALGGEFLANPFPILHAILGNQVAYAEQLGGSLVGAGQGIATALQGVPEVLQAAFGQLSTGDIYGAAGTLFTGVFGFSGPILQAALPLLEGIVPIVQNITGNLNTLATDGVLGVLLLALAPVYPLAAATAGTAGVTENIVDALGSGNVVGALENIALAPSTVVGSLLNGYSGPLGSFFVDPSGGFLTGPDVGFGTIQNTLFASSLIANLIAPFTPTTTLAMGATSFDALSDPTALLNDLGGLTAFDPTSIFDAVSGLPGAADIGSLLDIGMFSDIGSTLLGLF